MTPDQEMPLDAVRKLNPNWEVWRTDTPMTGEYHAKRPYYSDLSAATPEDLHNKILIAEAQAAWNTP